jgi:hypothetical protein
MVVVASYRRLVLIPTLCACAKDAENRDAARNAKIIIAFFILIKVSTVLLALEAKRNCAKVINK